jgi:2-oxoglutarate ferredoxin oxidoreductase subunit beta
VQGEPIRFGSDGSKGLIRDTTTGGVKIVRVGSAPDQASPDDLLVHDAYNPDPTTAFAISRLTDAGRLHQAPIGIFRQVARPTYDDQAREQITQAAAGVGGSPSERLASLIGGGDTWTVA